jgi:dihydropteroate synthase
MTRGLYLRPLGLVHGPAARAAADAGQAALLAGGPVTFTALEVIEGGVGNTRRSLRAYADVAASKEGAVKKTLARITAPRAPVGGLAIDEPRIMGVVNVTPDSFSDGGLYDTTEAAVVRGATLVAEGADILDVGGESTRPGSDPVEAELEAERIIPVIEGLRGVKALISADTRKSSVMRHAADAGADILNDISALSHDAESLEAARETGLPVVLMHAQGDPRTMQDDPSYEDVLLEVYDYLAARIATCENAGIERSKLIADPGIGFGKTLEHNLTLLEGLSLFHGLGVPLLLGASRKRFIGTLANVPEARERVPGSIAAALAAIARGVQLVRVHDVAATRQAITVWNSINS